MSYASAASSGIGNGSQLKSSKERFYNQKMIIVCMANGFTYEQLADKLNKLNVWESVSGYQKVDFNRRFALVVEDAELRDVLSGERFKCE